MWLKCKHCKCQFTKVLDEDESLDHDQTCAKCEWKRQYFADVKAGVFDPDDNNEDDF